MFEGRRRKVWLVQWKNILNKIDSIKIQSRGTCLSIYSYRLVWLISHVIWNKSPFFLSLSLSLVRIYALLATINDSLKVIFHTKQITTNIFRGKSIYVSRERERKSLLCLSIKVFYTPCMYSYMQCRNCSDLMICYACNDIRRRRRTTTTTMKRGEKKNEYHNEIKW